MKLKKKFLLAILPIASISTIPFVAAACQQKNDVEKPPVKVEITSLTKEELDAEVDKITATTTAKTLAEVQANLALVKLSGYDAKKVSAKINSVSVGTRDKNIKVNVQVVQLLKEDNKSKERIISLDLVADTTTGSDTKPTPDPVPEPTPTPSPTDELNTLASALVLSYTEDASKLKANQVELAKILVKNGENALDASMTVENLAFVNEQASENEINSGTRNVKFTIKKGELVSNEVTKSLTVHPSDVNFIENQKSLIQNAYKAVDTYEAIDALDKLEDGSVIAFDYKTFSFYTGAYQNKVDIFELKEGLTLISDTATVTTQNINVANERNKATFNKLEDGSFKLSFYLGKYSYTEANRRVDNEMMNITIPASKLKTKAELDEIASGMINSFDFTDKANTYVQDAKKIGIIIPTLAEGTKLNIDDFAYDLSANSVSFNFNLSSTDKNGVSKISENHKVTIDGFKENELAKILDSLTVDYTGKDAVVPSTIESLDALTIQKDSADYTPAEGITLDKVIVKEKTNDVEGTLVVKITLTQDTNVTAKEFAISGFKVGELDLEALANSLTVNLKDVPDKALVKASSIAEENIEVSDPAGNLDKVTLTKSLAAVDGEGKLVITLKVTTEANVEGKTKVIDITGFKVRKTNEQILSEWAELAKAGNLFVNNIPENMNILNGITATTANGIYIKNNTFLAGASSKTANRGPLQFKFINEEYNEPEYQELLKETIVNEQKVTNPKSTTKALYAKKNDDGKYVIKFTLTLPGTKQSTLIEGAEVYEVVFE